jgi:hypothetical protein
MSVRRRNVTRRSAAVMVAGAPAVVAVACTGPRNVASGGGTAGSRRTGLRLTTSACGQL